jgi:hypothetical protein
LGYTILHLCLDNGLPWANLPHSSKSLLKIREEIHELKKIHSVASMCGELPLPVAQAFCSYFKNVRALGHAERPDCEHPSSDFSFRVSPAYLICSDATLSEWYRLHEHDKKAIFSYQTS